MYSSNASISKRGTKIAQISSQVANLCEDSNLHDKPRESQTLKILHLASDSIRGGAERVYKNTIEITSKDFIVYTASCDEMIRDSQRHIKLDDYRKYGKIIGSTKFIFNLKNYKILLSALNELKVDIVHVQNYLSSLSPSVLFALKAYKKSNPHLKLIYTQHGYGVCTNGCLYNYYKSEICHNCIKANKLQIATKNCDRRGRIYSALKALRSVFYQGIFLKEQDLFDKIIFVGEFQMQKHIDDGYDKTKLKVITNPIDSSFYNPNAIDKKNLIIFFGRICREKNVSLLIEAFYELLKKREFKDYRLLIIGNGDDKARCENLSNRLFCDYKQKPCAFIPHLKVEKLGKLAQKAKISVLPSLCYETFGLSIVESILAGILPIASDIGALGETMRRFGGFGFVPNSKESLCEVMTKVLSNYEIYAKEIPIYQAKIRKEMNYRRYLEELEAIYT